MRSRANIALIIQTTTSLRNQRTIVETFLRNFISYFNFESREIRFALLTYNGQSFSNANFKFTFEAEQTRENILRLMVDALQASFNAGGTGNDISAALDYVRVNFFQSRFRDANYVLTVIGNVNSEAQVRIQTAAQQMRNRRVVVIAARYPTSQIQQQQLLWITYGPEQSLYSVDLNFGDTFGVVQTMQRSASVFQDAPVVEPPPPVGVPGPAPGPTG